MDNNFDSASSFLDKDMIVLNGTLNTIFRWFGALAVGMCLIALALLYIG